MPLRPHEEYTSGFALRPQEPEKEQHEFTSMGPTLKAAFALENDMVAAWDLFTRPEFERDDAFDPLKATRESEFWDTHRENFVGTVSQEHWDYIANKIRTEEKHREQLAAAGVGGFGAMLLAGVASPTMFIPALAPYRGARGIAAAAGLGAGAALAQEAPLQLAQETRGGEDLLAALAGGTILGGLIGGGAQALRFTDEVGQIYSNVRRRFEMDMANTRGERAIPEDETIDPSTIRPLEDGPGQVVPRADEFDIRPTRTPTQESVALGRAVTVGKGEKAVEWRKPQAAQVADETSASVEQVQFNDLFVAADWKDVKRQLDLPQNKSAAEVVERARQEGYDGIRFTDTKDGQPTYVRIPNPLETVVEQEGPAFHTPATNPVNDAFAITPAPAGAQINIAPQTSGLEPIRGIDTLAKLSPVAATIAQDTFKVLRQGMAKMSTAGLRLRGNADFIPASPGGTVEARVGTYDAFIGKLVRTLDEAYTDYFYNGQTKPLLGTNIAHIRSAFRFTGDRLTYDQFNREVSRAMFDGDVHPVTQVANTAKILRQEIYDPILERAKEAGLFEAGSLFDDASYLSRMWDTSKIDANPAELVRRLADHFERLLQDDVAKATDRLREQRRILDEYIDDVEADAEEVEARRAESQARLEELGETDEETAISALRREQREIRKRKGTGRPIADAKLDEARLEEIKAEIKTLQEAIAPQVEEKRGLRRRLRNLNRSFVAVEEKRAKKLERIERAEARALESLRGVLAKGKRLQRDLFKLSPKELQRQTDLLVERLRNAEEGFADRMERLERASAEGNMDEFHALMKDDKIDELPGRIERYEDRLLEIDDLIENRQGIAELLEDLALEASESINKLNLRRGERIAKLREQAAKLTPEQVAGRVDEARAKQSGREARFFERFREMGVDDIDIETGNAMVREVAQKRAEAAVQKVGKYNNRISGLHVLGEERGSELARVLSIPSRDVFDYLVTDIQRVTRNYIRQVAADIELKRAYGDVDAKMLFQDAAEEFAEVQRQAEARGASKAEMDRLSKDYRKYARYMTASIMRLRHTWGIPENPQGFVARAGKLMLDLNTARFMGSVAISSVPDLSRVIVKNGMMRTMGDGFGVLVRDLKTFKMAAREVKLAGEALDPITHSRAMGFADLMDEYVGASVPERVVHTAATKMGVLAGFDYWTSFMKQINGVLTINQLMDSMDLVVNGGGTAKEVAEATRYLAEHGYNADLAQRTWTEVTEGGGTKNGSTWLPNTEDWQDQNLVMAFRAAVSQASRNTIITPGLELPLMTNSSVGARMLFQFKSFALASHTKTVMAGLQQRDAALFNGMASSLALGAVSYYLWANTVGGTAKEEMLNAPTEKWMDEAIARSGLLAAFGEVQRIAERIPLTAPYANLSGERTTRRAGSTLVEAVLGPSFDLASTVADVAVGIDDPTQSTAHQVRTILMFQNIFYFRWLFNLVEESVKEQLPERREAQ